MAACRTTVAWTAAVLAATLPCLSMAEGMPIGHWVFDEADGSMAYDRAGRADGTLMDGNATGNGPRFVSDGKVAGALLFDAKDDCVYLGHPRVFELGRRDFTLTGWLKLSAVRGEVDRTVVENSRHSTRGLSVRVPRPANRESAGRLVMDIKGPGGNVFVRSDERVDDDRWHWFAVQVRQQAMAMWIDGVRQKMSTPYKATTSASAYRQTTFGGRLGGGAFGGLLDDIRLYGAALSESALRDVYRGVDSRRRPPAADRVTKPAMVIVVQPVSRIRRLPDVYPWDGTIGTTLHVAVTPSEYEPASFVIRAGEDLKSVTFRVGELSADAGTIDAGHVDIRGVKCWYQAGTAWQGIRARPSARVLVPELLLRDDQLVKVDYQRKANYVRLAYPDGERYVDMSQAAPKNQPGMENREFPVRDSATLRPVDIAKGAYKQFWITVHAPAEAAAGHYRGTIRIGAQGKLVETLSLNVRVLPFRLMEPRTYHDPSRTFTSSIYYKGILTKDRGTVFGWYKTEQQFRSDLRNMVEHGVTNPVILQLEVDDSLEHLEQVLQIREELGMINNPLYLLGKERNLGFGNTRDPTETERAQSRLRGILAAARKHGAEDVYVYGIDEAKGDLLASQKPIWRAFQAAGASIFTSGFMHRTPSPFELVGDTLNLLVNAGVPKREYAAQWHGAGRRIWCYGNPQGGVENPEVYRRNFGLLLWKANYDGACTYVYHHGYGHSWNDFDSTKWRDHNLTYPTIDGVIDTIAWEGYREGIDDIRYGTTLKLAITAARGSDDPALRALAEQADGWLENVDAERRDLDAVRLEMIEHILRLREALPI